MYTVHFSVNLKHSKQTKMLTLKVRNALNLLAETQFNIKVKDVNNQSPVFYV